jgi:hypothetical protein
VPAQDILEERAREPDIVDGEVEVGRLHGWSPKVGAYGAPDGSLPADLFEHNLYR